MKIELFRKEEEWVIDKHATVRYVFKGSKLMYKIFLRIFKRFVIIEWSGRESENIEELRNIQEDIY